MAGKGKEGRHVFLRFCFFLYAAVMLWLLFGQRFGDVDISGYQQQLQSNMNLQPLATVRLYIRLLSGGYSETLMRHAFINLVGNVVLFVPLGIFLPGIWQKMRKFFVFLLTVAVSIVAVELLQLVTLLGSCDVDDLLLNVAGALLGFGIWKLFLGRKSK